MKSFKQFLSEEEARQGKLLTNKGTAQNFKNPKKVPFIGTDPTPTSGSSGSSEAPKPQKVSPGQMEIPSGKSPTGTTTKVSGSKVRGAAADPWKQFPKKPQQQLGMPKTGPSSTLPGKTLAPAGGTTPKPALPAVGQTQKGGALATTPKSGALATNPPIQAVKVSDITPKQGKLPSGTTGGTLATRSSSTPATNPPIKPVKVTDITKSKGKLPSGTPPTSSARQGIQTTKTGTDLAKTATDTLGKGGRFSKWGGRALGAVGAGLDAADEYKAQRERGRSRGSSVAMGVTKAAGGIAGAEAGASAGAALGGTIGSIVPGAGTAIGAGIGGVVGGIGGYMAGSGLAGKASEVVAGATGKEKAAMAAANRQRQAGGAIKGIGGPTSFDTKKNTITTGTGAQRKTAQLAKTSVVTGPGGKQDTGYLAYKGGKAVYKRAQDPSTLARTSSNSLERIGRSLFAGAYKQSDAANAAKKLAAARQSDVARNKALGVKMLPGK